MSRSMAVSHSLNARRERRAIIKHNTPDLRDVVAVPFCRIVERAHGLLHVSLLRSKPK